MASKCIIERSSGQAAKTKPQEETTLQPRRTYRSRFLDTLLFDLDMKSKEKQ
jgi:hypothetical protein